MLWTKRAIQKQKLNAFRRKVFDEIYNIIVKSYERNIQKIKITNNYKIKKFEDFQIIENLNEKLTHKNIIYSPSEYNENEILKLKQLCEKENKVLYLDTPNFMLEKDIKLLENIINNTKVNIIANNYHALSFNTNIIIGAGLNVYNNYTASVYNKPVICAESNISTKTNYPFMTLRHCPFKNLLKANCYNCPYKKGFYYLKKYAIIKTITL